MKKYFEEQQRFSQWWFWALLLLTAAILSIQLLQSYNQGPDGGDSIIDLLLALGFLVLLSLFVTIYHYFENKKKVLN